MNNKLWVISVGGSKIVPKEVDFEFLARFKDLIDSHPSHKFVVVTGGGSTARNYINALRKLGKGTKAQSIAGISVTRLHALFLARLFGEKANDELPMNMKKVKNLLNKNQIVFCGALRYEKKNTSDGTSAKLAAFLNTSFINLTNVKGLHTSNPLTNKNAKLIPKISWRAFKKRADQIRYKAGQHFVLDQAAARIILENKIPTYIVGSVGEIDKIIRGRKFVGTEISG